VVQNLTQISKKYASKKLYSKDSRDLLKKEAKTKKVEERTKSIFKRLDKIG
jgi:hypothetical protein